jgi:hypothetical protein
LSGDKLLKPNSTTPAPVSSPAAGRVCLCVDDAQQRAAGFKALSSTAKPAAGCPLAFKLDRNAFWFHDQAAHVVEVLESGVDPELGCKLLIPEDMLLRAVHSADMQRALSMLTIAIGHGAVTCVVVANKDDAAGTCRVVHLHVDVPETLWLVALQKSRNADSPELPCTSALTMCFGKALGGATGGYTAGSREVVDMLRQRARPYLFSNSVAPAVVGANGTDSPTGNALSSPSTVLFGRPVVLTSTPNVLLASKVA